ncbi:invasion associated locus B family protein [Acuticoccus sp. 2012]|uniref:Invasion associated locus B family protein n=1 Tax=Acuticoccus mangrovi TaxID=2796142 RepID=A0A934IMT1_9HYPH|nr:invasion associated locus B family protein [Acuticoccus mangrovi]
MTSLPQSRRRRPLTALVRRAVWLGALAVVGVLTGSASSWAQTPDALTEVYRDWTVRCAKQNDTRRCWMVQALSRGEAGERILQMEIALLDDDVTMVLLTPLGVLLSEGTAVKVDENAERTLSYRMCVPAGCIVETKPSTAEIAELQRGGKMSVRFVLAQNNAKLQLDISLAGFSAAYTRLTALAKG